MAESTGYIGHGSSLSYGSTATGSWTTIGMVEDIKVPEPEVDDVELTNQDSPNSYKEYIPGLIEGGQGEFDLIYNKTQQSTLYGIVGTLQYFKIGLPDSSTMIWHGYLKKLGLEAPVGDKIASNGNIIKVTSKPTFTAG